MIPDDLDQYLDEHPCPQCGNHYYDHDNLTREELEEAKADGCTVTICDTRSFIEASSLKEAIAALSREDSRTYWCFIVEPPEDPCDEEFMKEISS